jgi:hypothetical protein
MQEDKRSQTEQEKVVSVEPAAEGPRMRIKKPLTEAQLAALRKGREKLAEKRKSAIADEAPVSADTNGADEGDETDNAESETESDSDYSYYCSIM